MSTQPSLEKLRQKLNLKRYLEELAVLTGRTVLGDELGGLELAVAIREASQKFATYTSASFEIPFSDRCSARFRQFVQKLHKANPTSVYLWTPRTIDCGVLLVPSLDVVKFDFDFDVNEEGILVLLSSDLVDRLLLDFSKSCTGEERMTVESQGINWMHVDY